MGIVPLTLEIGPGAQSGLYDITAQFVSNGQKGVKFGDDGFLRFQLQVVPEPSALALAAFGLLGLVAYGWRRKRS